MKTITLYATATAAGDVRSGILDLVDLTNYSMQVDFSGGGSDLVGTLYLEVSNDGTNFVTLTGSNQAVSASADHMYDIDGGSYRYVRVFWDFTSGTGNITVTAFIKEKVVVGA